MKLPAMELSESLYLLSRVFHTQFGLKFNLLRYPMNLAETASIFFETVVGDRLIEMAGTPEEKLRCVGGWVLVWVGTAHRQT